MRHVYYSRLFNVQPSYIFIYTYWLKIFPIEVNSKQQSRSVATNKQFHFDSGFSVQTEEIFSGIEA